MDDTLAVGVVERFGDLCGDVRGRNRVEPATKGDAIGERLAGHELEDDGGPIVIGRDVVHGDDPGMGEPRSRPRLGSEPRPRCLVGEQVAMQELEGDLPVELFVMGAPYLGAATRPEPLLEAIAPEQDVGVARRRS